MQVEVRDGELPAAGTPASLPPPLHAPSGRFPAPHRSRGADGPAAARSPEDDKASLEAAQQVLAKHLADIKAVKGVKSVQRTVCGGCLDFKVATALGDSDFGAWEEAGFAPEASVLEELKAIPGITLVETQT